MTAGLIFKRLFDWKIRGVRWVEIIGGLLVAVMVLSVYIAKAAAAREGSQIGELESQIAENRQRVRLLNAEISRLEQPARLEALSRAAGLGPVTARRQATEAQLPALQAMPQPAAPVPAASVPAAAPAAAPADDAAKTAGEAL